MATIDWGATAIRQRRIGADVTALIEGMIAGGELGAGARLPSEREIAQSLKVSRSSVRDAMSELALKGLIDRKPGRGTVVLPPTGTTGHLRAAFDAERRETFQVTDLRQVIEPAIAERAASRATPADLQRMRIVLEQAADGASLSAADSLRLDQEFHLAVAGGAQNELLSTLLGSVSDSLLKIRAKSHRTKAGRTASVRGHLVILEAIERHDAGAARQAMRDHILDVGGIAAPGSTSESGTVTSD